MAFKMNVTGMGELIKKVEQLGVKAPDAASKALYEGARVVADAVSSAVQGIATEPFKYAAGGRTRKPSPEEKRVVQEAPHGVAKFQRKITSINTSVGLQNAGYGEMNGKTVPIPKIANAINSGTSFMKKQPFMRKAFSTSKKAAEAAIESKLREELDKLSID